MVTDASALDLTGKVAVVRSLPSAIGERFGRVDILINNAGGGFCAPAGGSG